MALPVVFFALKKFFKKFWKIMYDFSFLKCYRSERVKNALITKRKEGKP